MKKRKIICTIGPASLNSDVLEKLKKLGADFFRINLSHTPFEEVEEKIIFLKEYNVPIIIDTEGPQVRTGNIDIIPFKEGEIVKLHSKKIDCNPRDLFLTPLRIINSLNVGDEISLEFGSTTFRVTDTSHLNEGYIECKVLLAGELGGKKAVHIESPNFILQDFSEKDLGAIELAKKYGVKHFTLSFMENAGSVKRIKEFYPEATLYSKIESRKGLENFEEIMKESDGILIDRGDLSSQVPIQKIPFAQKHLIERCNQANKEVFVATDTLQNMFSSPRPNAADANDMVNNLLDGATGIALTKETAAGKYPVETLEMLCEIIEQVEKIDLSKDKHSPEILKKILEDGTVHKAKILWFTGLSGSGKTTIAELLKKELESKNKKVKIFDGDIVRNTLHKNLGFSPEDIQENNRLISELCKKEQKNFDFILVPIISPFEESRKKAREIFQKDFVEIFLDCPFSECKDRDVKGLYTKAIQGGVQNFIGIQVPYEPPKNPELALKTIEETPEQSTNKIINFLDTSS